jgi:hypothetical protein
MSWGRVQETLSTIYKLIHTIAKSSHTVQCSLALVRRTLTNATRWVNPEATVLSERSQTGEATDHMSPYM